MRQARPQKARTVVLCYHSIGTGDSPLSLPVEVFRAQVELLGEQGFDFVSFGKLADTLGGGSLPARPTAVLTFDDGFADTYSVAWPILCELGIPATCFVTTGLMQGDLRACTVRGTGAKLQRALSGPAQVAELAGAGCEIGAHTHTHRNLMRLDAEEATEELRRSRAILEEVTEADVRVLAYPFGTYGVHYTDRTVQIARELGFSGAAAVANRGVGSRDRGRALRVPRFTPVREDPAWFKRRMLGDLDWVCWLRSEGRCRGSFSMPRDV